MTVIINQLSDLDYMTSSTKEMPVARLSTKHYILLPLLKLFFVWICSCNCLFIVDAGAGSM